ncbi:MAG: LysR substrate-binding domain-containing protein [Pseudomonadota bacterium]
MVEFSVLASKVRIRQLRCFVFVARRRSFVAAADEMGLTQPAISRSVRELEQIIGGALFDRSLRGAQLTDKGKLLLEAAELGLLQISQGLNAASDNRDLLGVVRVGALPNVCSQFLPDIIRDFKSAHPEVTVRIVPGVNAELLAGLKRGETDMVIGRLSSSEDMRGLVFEALFDEPLIFVVRNDHPLTATTPALEDVLAYPMILPPDGTIIRQEASRFLAAQGVTHLANLIETTSSDFQRAYLQITDCVLLVPRGVVQRDVGAGRLSTLAIEERSLLGPVGLTLNPEAQIGEAAKRLCDLIRPDHSI